MEMADEDVGLGEFALSRIDDVHWWVRLSHLKMGK